jgi:hypothetical protein
MRLTSMRFTGVEPGKCCEGYGSYVILRFQLMFE